MNNSAMETSIFGYRLSKLLENRILGYLDTDSIPACRMVSSQWRTAVDSLQPIWSGFARRLCETGVWITCGFCEKPDESSILDDDLKLSWLSQPDTMEFGDIQPVRVTAFNPSQAAYHKWLLRVSMDGTVPRIRVAKNNENWRLHMCADWFCLVQVELCNTDGANTGLGFVEQYDSESSSISEGSAEETSLRHIANDGYSSTDEVSQPSQIDILPRKEPDVVPLFSDGSSEENSPQPPMKASIADSHVSGHDYRTNQEPKASHETNVPNAGSDSDSSIDSKTNQKEPKTNRELKVPWLDSQEVRLPSEVQQPTSFIADYYAVLPLRTRMDAPVIPRLLICIPTNERVIRLASVRKCQSCSETQLVVLTETSLMLYILELPVTCERGQSKLKLVKPAGSINLTIEGKSYGCPSHIAEVTSRSDACSQDSYFFIVAYESGKLLQLFRVACRELQKLNSVQQTKRTWSCFASDDSSDVFILPLGYSTRTKLKTMRIVRPFVSNQDCLELDYGPCEYYNPLKQVRSYTGSDFQVGRQLWYCMGKSNNGTALAIFRMGCSRPLLVLELNDLIPVTFWEHSESMFLATNWINCGFCTATNNPTPFVSMRWKDSVHLLLSWSFSPPTRSMIARCTRVKVPWNFVRNIPWFSSGSNSP